MLLYLNLYEILLISYVCNFNYIIITNINERVKCVYDKNRISERRYGFCELDEKTAYLSKNMLYVL